MPSFRTLTSNLPPLPLPPFVPSRSGLLHTLVEPQGRPPAQDHPVAPPGCQRPDPERRLLLQAGRQKRSARPAHGRQTRPLLFPLQRRLPGHRGEAPRILGGKDCQLKVHISLHITVRTVKLLRKTT